MAMHNSIIGGNSDGLFVMLNGKFCAAQFIQRQPQLVVGLCMIGLDEQELLIALDRHIELFLLVGNHGQNKDGAGVLLIAQYEFTNILGLLKPAFLVMV